MCQWSETPSDINIHVCDGAMSKTEQNSNNENSVGVDEGTCIAVVVEDNVFNRSNKDIGVNPGV